MSSDRPPPSGLERAWSGRQGVAALFALLAACGSASHEGTAAATVDLRGAGATFPYPLYRVWFADYGKRAGARISYFSVGSAEGMRLLATGEVDFGATEIPLAVDTAASACGPVAVPTVTGAVAVIYNLPGITDALRFDVHLLADIFSGRVARWDAAPIRVLNPGVRLPATPIAVVHRSAGSGTSLAFGTFLARSPRWPHPSHGKRSGAEWPVGTSVEGNEGVAAQVKATVGAIGYAELAYARQNNVGVGAVRDARDAYAIPGGGVGTEYPIVIQTWFVFDRHRLTEAKGAAVVAFLRWALRDGSDAARALEYSPLPLARVAHYDSLLAAVRFGPCGSPAAAAAR